jgi:hypothetical protein
MEILQRFHNRDYDRRLQFANFVVNKMTEADLKSDVFSDETTFSLDREVTS